MIHTQSDNPLPDPFDLGRAQAHTPPDQPLANALPRHRPGEKFLKGPIPWAWIEAAAKLPGQALAVGLGLWFEAGCRNAATVPVTLRRLARLGMSRDSARRGVRPLEECGLVAVQREPGCGLRVTLRATPPASPVGPAP